MRRRPRSSPRPRGLLPVGDRRGKSSLACAQVISIFRWTDSTWVQLDSRSIGTTEEVAGLTPGGTLADYVSGSSGPGDVVSGLSCSRAALLNLSADLLKPVVSQS